GTCNDPDALEDPKVLDGPTGGGGGGGDPGGVFGVGFPHSLVKNLFHVCFWQISEAIPE
ncbi:hypothetical protein Tco_0470320, partial [Tanacetum coccineum]